MRFSFTINAADGESFGRDAFETSIGQSINVGDLSGTYRAACVAAVVAEDGRSAEITLETEGPLSDVVHRRMNVSFAALFAPEACADRPASLLDIGRP